MHNCFQNYYLLLQNEVRVWGGGAAPSLEKYKNVMNCFTTTWFGKCTAVISYSKLHSPSVANYFSAHKISLCYNYRSKILVIV